MLSSNQTRKTLEVETSVDTTTANRSSEELEDEEVEQLELEVNEMAKKILDYRATLPNHITTTLSSILSAQRPLLPEFDSGSGPEPACNSNSQGIGLNTKSNEPALLTQGDEKIADKVRLLKDKVSRNVAAMPVVLNRMKECMSKIDKLDSSNGIIHPAFQKKTS